MKLSKQSIYYVLNSNYICCILLMSYIGHVDTGLTFADINTFTTMQQLIYCCELNLSSSRRSNILLRGRRFY